MKTFLLRLTISLGALVTGWLLFSAWQLPASRLNPEASDPSLLSHPCLDCTSQKVASFQHPIGSMSRSPAQSIIATPEQNQAQALTTRHYVRGQMPDNLLAISNADIRKFDRKISPETAGQKVYMHKLRQQPRDEDWAAATEEVLWQVQAQFYSAINGTTADKVEALHVECRTDLCYVDLPYDSYGRADRIRRGNDPKMDFGIFSLVGQEGEPFSHQLIVNGVGPSEDNQDVTRWILGFDRGEATASLYTSPPPG